MQSVVIGASGLIGSTVSKYFRDLGFSVTGTHFTSPTSDTEVQVDKRDDEAIRDVITERDPDVVVDTAAFHDVDACERQRKRAWSVNAEGTRNAAVAADHVGAHFIYISTDYVFPGVPEQAPYTEDQPAAPVNYYAQSKYAGEQAAKIPDQWTILRSGVVYGTGGENFLTWVVEKLQTDEEVDVVADQVGTPTYALDVAEACSKLVRESVTGLFHAGGPESVSRYEFARRIAEAYDNAPQRVNPIPTEELSQQAARPQNSSLDSSMLYETIDYTFRDTGTSLQQLFHDRIPNLQTK